MQNTILAFVGMMGSGKGTCVEFFTDQSLPHVYFGGMVYEEVAKRGLDRVKDEIFVRGDMRAKEGPAVLAKRAAEHAHKLFAAGHQTIVFDGLYSWDEFEFLKETFGDQLQVCAVVADRQLRHQRILDRQDGRQYTREQIIKRETDEIENLNKGGPIAAADHYLFNNGTIQDLNTQLTDLQKFLKLA